MARAGGEEDEAARVAAVVERVEGRGAERVRVERNRGARARPAVREEAGRDQRHLDDAAEFKAVVVAHGDERVAAFGFGRDEKVYPFGRGEEQLRGAVVDGDGRVAKLGRERAVGFARGFRRIEREAFAFGDGYRTRRDDARGRAG